MLRCAKTTQNKYCMPFGNEVIHITGDNRSATTVGNWAMERQFFFDIGGLDTDMALWGGENIDISIRVRIATGKLWQYMYIPPYVPP